MNKRVTMIEGAIHNPSEPRHFMQIKPVTREVSIWIGETLVAKTSDALRVLEVGAQAYDPVLYVPREDIQGSIQRSDKPTTHCPLKGDASYFDITDESGSLIGEAMAWSYEYTYGFARQLEDRIAFFGDKVSIQERPFTHQLDTI